MTSGYIYQQELGLNRKFLIHHFIPFINETA